MKRRLFCILSTLVATLVVNSQAFSDQTNLKILEEITGYIAYQHVYYISEDIGAREVGSTQEYETADYIAEEFEVMGYDVEIQPFTFERSGVIYESANIIATKHGKFDQTVIVGAHYDSVAERTCADGNVSTGAGDNASGIGVMLEVAGVLANYNTLGTIKFIAFGAEERGLRGSAYYADQMQENEINNTVAMVNLDAVGAGDYFYVYAGLDDNPGWARDLALSIGQNIGYDIRTSPESEYFDYGTTGDWSDQVPFRLLGIPIAYFEWMNWDIEPDGGIETEEFGWIMHSCLDNIGHVDFDKLEFTADVVGSLVYEMSKTKLPKSDRGKIGKINKYIRVQKRNDQPY